MAGQSRISDTDPAWAHTVLATEGILPGESGYDEATLAMALSQRGWSYAFTGATGAWTAEVFDQPAAIRQSLSRASGEDRETALLVACALALHTQGSP